MKKMNLWNSLKINMLRLLSSLKTWDIMVPTLGLKKMELDDHLRLIVILKDMVWAPFNPRCHLLTTIVWLNLILTLKRRNSLKYPSNTLRMT